VKILIVVATEGEYPPGAAKPGHIVKVLPTGVGMVATATWCTRELMRERYDLALNVGVCGSFRPEFGPGTVVHVVADRMSELGAQDGESFLTIHDLGLLGPNDGLFRNGLLVNPAPPVIPALIELPAVTGITVNTVHGEAAAIDRIVERLQPDVESMEGAAFMYACLAHGVPFAQVRAVSNMVERRNRAAWKLPEAITALGSVTARILATA
jgi:futalosine hydrolase